jgi:hypothetical protein
MTLRSIVQLLITSALPTTPELFAICTLNHSSDPGTHLKRIESPLKYQHRCVSIFDDKKNAPTGFALGSVEGRVAIQYVNAQNPKDNFTFKCHRSNGTSGGFQVGVFSDQIFRLSFVCECRNDIKE